MLRKLTDGRVSPAMAVFLTSLFYSLYHVLSIVPIFERPWNIVLVLPVFAAGLFWGWMRLRHASLTGSVLSHSFADAGIMCVYFLYLSLPCADKAQPGPSAPVQMLDPQVFREMLL
ncbi:CPBP family intramembrane glutamic endopeptidase [Paenibacillus tyrfis]|uniref:CPBP family intramembrane glutamic endopeptidase n=1 Tax=Paenibacillus tyrfis TaxID=1501230 RepID=UPI0020A098BB|nr:CPBP family intramembrane glutamic endopeptidase [Paenibacillus tyrfis]MCP1310571.1 CPBP family intramembrane metalloprotease [Paenibacillus tyrfis]